MYVLFDKIADTARVWIYQANRKLDQNENKKLEEQANYKLSSSQKRSSITPMGDNRLE